MRRWVAEGRHFLRRRVPEPLRQRARQMTGLRRVTVAQGWERIARSYHGATGRLGDAWTEPESLGVDVPAERFVAHLDEVVFGTFLGHPEVLLEIGPGGGRFTEALLQRCGRLIAADTSPTMLRLLRDRLGDAGEQVDYVLLDGQGLSFLPDNSVDAAFSYDVFVHLPHWDFYNYLVELARVLRPGAPAVIHHANTFSELGWTKFLADLRQSVGRHRLPTSFTVMDCRLMQELSGRAGLQVERCVTEVVRRDCITLLRAPVP